MRQGIRDRRDASVREFDQQRLGREVPRYESQIDREQGRMQANMAPSPQGAGGPMDELYSQGQKRIQEQIAQEQAAIQSIAPRPQTLDPAEYDFPSDEIQAPAPQAPAPQAFNEGVANRGPLQVQQNTPAPIQMNPFDRLRDRNVMPGQTSPVPQTIMPPEPQAIQPEPGPMGPPTPAPAAPPTNQFGQPIRGILPPERAPEDPNRVMEQFGRGSPEHIQALQAQMRTQQVAVSRPEDMADPRLDHLPTGEQYDMNLTRRRYGEEAIDKRAGELMKGDPLGRTEADAVRMAGREALNQRRRDRGMLDLDQMEERREGIRDRQQEMFEQRRGRERGERQQRRERDRLEREAFEAGMSVPEYQRVQAETEAISAPERIAAADRDLQRKALAQQGEESQRSYDAQIAQLEQQGRQFDATNLRAIQEFERTSGLREKELNNAATALSNDNEYKNTMAKIAQGELDLKKTAQAFAETQFAKRGELNKAELLTMVVQAAAASQGTFTVSQLVGELASVDPMISEMIDPTVLENADKMIGERRTSSGARSAEKIISLDTPMDWIEPFGDIQSDWLGFYMAENTERVQRGYLSSMDQAIHELATMEDREAAQQAAADLGQRLTDAGYDDTFDPVGLGITFGVTLADQMDDARSAGYSLIQTIATGGDVDSEALRTYNTEYRNVDGQRPSRFRQTTPRRNQ